MSAQERGREDLSGGRVGDFSEPHLEDRAASVEGSRVETSSVNAVSPEVVSDLLNEGERFGLRADSEERQLLDKLVKHHQDLERVASVLTRMAKTTPEAELDDPRQVVAVLSEVVRRDDAKDKRWVDSLGRMSNEDAEALDALRESYEGARSELQSLDRKNRSELQALDRPNPEARIDRLIKVLDNSWRNVVSGDEITSNDVDGFEDALIGVRAVSDFLRVHSVTHPNSECCYLTEVEKKVSRGEYIATIDVELVRDGRKYWMESKRNLFERDTSNFVNTMDEIRRLRYIADDPEYHHQGERPLIVVVVGHNMDYESMEALGEAGADGILFERGLWDFDLDPVSRGSKSHFLMFNRDKV